MTGRTEATFCNKNCWILVIFSALVGVQSIETTYFRDERCDYSNLQTCSSVFDSVANNFDLSWPNSEDSLRSICRQLNEGFTCVDQYVKDCYKINYQILYQVAVRGAKSTTEHLCSNNTSPVEFLSKQTSCLKSANLSQANCSNFLARTTLVLSGEKEIEAEDVVRTICCSWNSFVNCKAKSVEELCGADESNWIRLLFKNVSGDLVLSHCYGYDSIVWPGCSRASATFDHNSHMARFFLNCALFFYPTFYLSNKM